MTDEKDPYVTITEGKDGWAVVKKAWVESKGVYEESGREYPSFFTPDSAIAAGKRWASREGISFYSLG